MKHRYMVLVVRGEGEENYSVYSPDVLGCVSVGDTVEEAFQNYREALQMHLEGTFEDGDPAPPATIVAAEFVEVEVEEPSPAVRAS